MRSKPAENRQAGKQFSLSLKPVSSGERDEFCRHERHRSKRLNSGLLEPALNGIGSFYQLKQELEEFSALSDEESFV
jgi:hypothetical protein